MKLRVIGCHGGETPKHRTSAFVLDGALAIDAGSLTSGLELDDQKALEACIVSHAHLDHIRDLATIADNRCQLQAEPLLVGATRPTIEALQKHFFNDLIWPDFTKIPAGNGPTLQFVELPLEQPTRVGRYTVRAIEVSHTIDTAGFVIEGQDGVLAYSGDTGPTDRFWDVLDELPNLRGLLMEVSFPDHQHSLAKVSGHHTPETMALDLNKFVRAKETPTLLYHIKPAFQAEVEKACAKLRGLNLEVADLDQVYEL